MPIALKHDKRPQASQCDHRSSNLSSDPCAFLTSQPGLLNVQSACALSQQFPRKTSQGRNIAEPGFDPGTFGL